MRDLIQYKRTKLQLIQKQISNYHYESILTVTKRFIDLYENNNPAELYEILSLDGVIGVKTLRLFQNTSELAGQSNISQRQLSYFNGDGTIDSVNGTPGYGFKYDFNAATVDDIVRPSATAAVFELRDPNNDIYGRVI